MSAATPTSAVLRSAITLGAGVFLGLSLPPLFRRLLSARESSKEKSTHAVRAGLNDSLRVPGDVLERFLTECLTAAGATREHAATAAAVLAFADARGIPSHGANRADTYANEIEAGVVDGHAEPAIEFKSGGCAVIDGKNALGTVVSSLAMRVALELAREVGISIVVCRRSNHYGAAGSTGRSSVERPG